MHHEHVWVRSLERKPYPGQPKKEYVRVVSTCACGARSVANHGAWMRRQKAKP